MKITKAQIFFLIILALLLSYFLTPILLFVLNKIPPMQALKLWSLDLTIKALQYRFPYAYSAFGISCLFSTCVVAIVPFIKKKQSLFGNARFANISDIRKMNLYGEKGIIIGKHNNKLLRFGGQQFVALGAPTRSGKGVGIVIPNLLEWNESAVVQDIKQECFDYTSKYREKVLQQEVFLFNPFSRKTHRYNPLTYIDMSNETTCDNELMDFANILYPIIGDETTKFFNQHAQNLFIALCYLWKDLTLTDLGQQFCEQFDIKTEFSLYGILQLSKGFRIKVIINEKEEEITDLEPSIEFLKSCDILSEITIRRLQTYQNITSDNTKSGIVGSFNAPLTAFESETLRYATQTSDFDLRDLRKKKMTIYVGITPDQLTNAKLILNIFWSQLILVNTKELPQKNKDLKYTCLLVMDEFTAPGQIQILQTSVSFIAGYNLRLLTIYQSLSQLQTPPPLGYGKEGAKTLLTNHACQIFYAPREIEDAEAISKILGNTTVKQTSRSSNSSASGGSSGRSISETHRALMLPQELREMPFENELITIDSGKPIQCQKSIYYSDKYFMNKFKSISPSLARIKGIPDRKAFEHAILNGEMAISIQIIGE
ncbi:MAG: type IV secretory system conjugative DNA transfer family protein [Helicobacter trogontum]|uniref:type IV secretory system conjugative DNA transfer family protein n=1 Tax=Helicobacter trogontum TaxID=50960 RepID=UPI000CF143C8|nr:type IV secretory system conjugative DNA transfer family protein [Helicobacter trogontum]MCI5786044.1 type IV secretory system conjugative DNA transfer family protein [Helicobacter trogontum]